MIHEFDDINNEMDPAKAPFDGEPVLVKWSAGWCEAWFCVEDYLWIALDDNLEFELDEVTHWTTLPEID